VILQQGTQVRLIAETTPAAGTTVQEGSVQSDAVLLTLFVNSVISGTLQVTVYTLTDTGKETELLSFPLISSATSTLLLKKSGVTMQRFRVVATYTGQCSYEVYAKAISNAGDSSARIIGNSNWSVGQLTVGTSPLLLISSALVDRQGVVVKNWSSTQNVYIAESSGAATTAGGYPLAPNDALAIDIAAGAEVYVVADGAGADVRYAQAGG
jgi:hypothetical protein